MKTTTLWKNIVGKDIFGAKVSCPHGKDPPPLANF